MTFESQNDRDKLKFINHEITKCTRKPINFHWNGSLMQHKLAIKMLVSCIR